MGLVLRRGGFPLSPEPPHPLKQSRPLLYSFWIAALVGINTFSGCVCLLASFFGYGQQQRSRSRSFPTAETGDYLIPRSRETSINTRNPRNSPPLKRRTAAERSRIPLLWGVGLLLNADFLPHNWEETPYGGEWMYNPQTPLTIPHRWWIRAERALAPWGVIDFLLCTSFLGFFVGFNANNRIS